MAVAVSKRFRGSRLLPGWSITRFFMPDTLSVEGDRLRIRRKKLFGLMSDEDEIRLERVASVRVRKGLLTGRLIIETAGGAMGDIEFAHIWKWQANRIAKTIRDLI